jgi:regulation of enolase protein 1 (concanavalin A-like superfamily)
VSASNFLPLLKLRRENPNPSPGTVHDTWGTNASDFNSTVPRIMQPVANGDFEIEVKFDAVLSQGYQMQGVLVEQDNNDMLRLEFLHDGSNFKVYAASFTEGAAATKYYSTIPSSNPIYMRVQRVGDQWTQSYSSDGVNWTAMNSFTHAMNVTAVGAYVGNSNAAHRASSLLMRIIGQSDPYFESPKPIISSIMCRCLKRCCARSCTFHRYGRTLSPTPPHQTTLQRWQQDC